MSESWNPDGPAVIVDPYSSGAQLAPAFAKRGVDSIAVLTAEQPPAVYAAAYRPQDFLDILVYRDNLAELIQQLMALGPRCVLAGCESGVELAELLAAAVVPQLANVVELAAARRHKGQMARAVTSAGHRTIPQICADDPEQVDRWLTEAGLVGRDLVIKPPKSASTDGVTLVPGGDGWQQVFQSSLGATNKLGIRNETLVVQQYVEGVEYVVDTFSYHGVHTVTDVCKYTKIHNGAHFAVYDTMEWLRPGDPSVPRLVDYARDVLDSVGVRYGPAHVEIMDTEDGPVLIELGARAHGGGHPRYCLIATEDSQIERTVRFFDGDDDIPLDYQLAQPTMVVFHLARYNAKIADTDGVQRIRALASYHDSTHNFAPGDRVEQTSDLFASLDLGFVVLSSQDPAQLHRDYRAIRSIEDEMFQPCQDIAQEAAGLDEEES